MGELVEHLEDIRSELEELEGLHAELGAPMQEYRAASNGIGDLSASNVVALAMVTFTLVLAIERVVSRMRGGKGGAV